MSDYRDLEAESSAADSLKALEADWRRWLVTLFPERITHDFAPHHEDFWEWVWSIQPFVRPTPRINIWPRGGAKSESAELAVVALGARNICRYGLYISGSQQRADEHVQNIANALESEEISVWYPDMAERGIGKFGQWKGWRRNRLHTRSGFVLDALGLDTASRGLKVESTRPGLLVFDDIDDHDDQPDAVQRKIDALTRRILPTTTSYAVILGIQNLIHRDSVFSQIADGRATFLQDRVVSGPIPAIIDLTYETRIDESGRPHDIITGGTPTWDALDIAACQAEITKEGISVFLSELQHETPDVTGGLYDHVTFRRAHYYSERCDLEPTTCTGNHVPDLDKVVCWVDPAVTDTDESDSQAVQIDGLSRDRTLYRLYSWEQRSSPQNAIQHALIKALEYGAIYVGIETDQGGDTWRSVFNEQLAVLGPAYSHIQMRSAKAGAGHGSKVHRSSQMLADYERGMIVHVEGTHHLLESALLRFPRRKPFDLADASWHGWWDLRRLQPATFKSARGRRPNGLPGRLPVTSLAQYRDIR